MESTLPEGHFRRVSGRAGLASVYLYQGKVEEANQAFEGQLVLAAQELGPDTPEYKELVDLNERIQAQMIRPLNQTAKPGQASVQARATGSRPTN